MARTKAKAALIAAAAILALGTTSVVLHYSASSQGAIRSQLLDDGCVLTLNQVLVDSHFRIAHGTVMAKVLGNAIPSNGVHLLNFNLNRPSVERFYSGSGGQSWLIAEFSLTGPHATNDPLVKPAFYHQYRFVISGESGIEFVQELWGDHFRSYPDGYYGYMVAYSFPRDSQWLGIRVERRQTPQQGGPWQKVAEFKVRNPAQATIQPWVAEPSPTTKSSSGLDFLLDGVTVKTIPYMSNDIWNHVVTAPMVVRSNGVLLTNWSASYGYVHAEDASGNWDSLAGHRSLDPRYVWKLEADFEPESNFSDENLATIRLPKGSSTITTNVMNMPVTISWDGSWVDASMPTNDSKLALRFVNAANDEGEDIAAGSGSWSQYQFRKGDFMTLGNNILTTGFKPTKMTLAIVPNLHITFYTRPKLVDDPTKN